MHWRYGGISIIHFTLLMDTEDGRWTTDIHVKTIPRLTGGN